MVLNKKFMITENNFLHEIAEIILSLFKDPAIGLTKETVCRDGHFSPKMLTVDKLLHMQCSTMLRLLLYLCMVLSDSEFRGLIRRLCNFILSVANDDEDAAYRIIDNHAGSPLKR